VRVCLNMIVRNESRVIERCLLSLAPVVDAWVISDTGSDDDTCEKIQSVMSQRGIPGQLYRDTWVDFAQNRNLALERARASKLGDYLFIIDADEVLRTDSPAPFSRLDVPCYSVEKRNGAMVWAVPALFRAELACQWRGVLHEYLDLPPGTVQQRLAGAHIQVNMDGCRSRNPHKYQRDAEVLEAEVLLHPEDARSRFYLAQSYRDAGKPDKAIENYAQRVAMGGWAEEAFIAQLEKGRAMLSAGRNYAECLPELLRAWEMRPTRAEPLYELTKYCRIHGLFQQGYLFGRQAICIEKPTDVLFVAEHVYTYAAFDEFSVCAYHSGHYRESEEACARILREGNLPESEKARVKRNLKVSFDRRAELEAADVKRVVGDVG